MFINVTGIALSNPYNRGAILFWRQPCDRENNQLNGVLFKTF
ncbi:MULTISPECIES: hypothetical protein [Desertifilum]|nr:MULTISPECIES: hypothetical protein [Desertifilum]MDA0213540.1 hypothetical protein [Cyanobacteria bacterium FC1]